MKPHEQLEQEFARWNGLDPAGMVACSSGTAALHLAFEAMQLPPGSEVIVPDLTMIACARAVALADLTPVFVDCDRRLLVDGALVRLAGLGATDESAPAEAVMFVHVYGRKCDIDSVVGRGFYTPMIVVEDLAEAHGIKPHPLTDAAAWSFYKNKVVAGEEGGAVWFRDPARAALARQLRSLGFTDAHDFDHVPRGHNYRLANALATPILMSLRNYDYNVAGRRRIEALYDARCPPEWRMPPRDVPWVYDLRVPGMTGAAQNGVVAALRVAGIQARHCFKPMHHQEEFCNNRFERASGKAPASVTASREVIYLPLTPGLAKDTDVDLVFDVIGRALR